MQYKKRLDKQGRRKSKENFVTVFKCIWGCHEMQGTTDTLCIVPKSGTQTQSEEVEGGTYGLNILRNFFPMR